MKKSIPTYKRIYSVFYSVSTVVIIALVLILTITLEKSDMKEPNSFSSGWNTENGDVHNIDKVRTRHFGGRVVLMHALPEDITDVDSLCFESVNVNLWVTIDGLEVYSYVSKENISGKGYGTAFHEVGLSKYEAGKIVKIEYSDIFDGEREGRITDVFIGPAADYIHFMVAQRSIETVISVIIFIFGVIMILVFLWISDKDSLPFDIAGLGVAAALLGLWLLLDTNMIQLLSGFSITCRVLNRMILFLVAFPLTCFFTSLSEQRRNIYNIIVLVVSAIIIAAMLGARYFAGIDMTDSRAPCLAVYMLIFFSVISASAIDNIIYCRAHNIKLKLGYVFVANTVLLGCASIDLALFVFNIHKKDTFGTFTRVGTLLFICIMMLQFLRWWIRDQESIERDRFFNKLMQYTISSDSSEDSLKYILEYAGKQFGAGRVIIFEGQENSKYHRTYEWYKEGRDPELLELLYLPYEGLIDEVYKTFEHNNNKLVLDNIESHKSQNFALYNVLKSNNVQNMIASPIEGTDKLLGIFVILDVPQDVLDEVAKIIGIISYFISQLLSRRNEEKRLKAYIYNDALTGAYNRRAYREYIGGGLDISSPFGYLVCEIRDLEKANKTLGFDSGDKIVIEAANQLMEVFGKDNVYRSSGIELVAFGFETDEAYFNNDVERFRKLAKSKNVNVCIGAVYCIYGTKDINMVIERAAYKLAQDKE